MSYEPTVWKDGDVVTSARLNKIEEGIQNASNNSNVAISDWNQNDPNGDGYIANRPFYVAGETNTEIVNNVFNFNNSNMSTAISLDEEKIIGVLENGMEFTAYYDGTYYSGEIINKDIYYFIGNCSIVPIPGMASEDNINMPFLLLVMVGGSQVQGGLILKDSYTGEKNISISIKTFDVHKIDRKYLPDSNFDLSDRIAKGVDNNGTEVQGAVVEGSFNNIASGMYSHVEGSNNVASGGLSHAEGGGTTASGTTSHAEGNGTTASSDYSHAEGGQTTASGQASHAEGTSTIAKHKSQHVFGEFNIEDTSTNKSYQRGTYVEIVGNGSNANSRSNARTLDWSGNEVLAGKLTVGAAPTNDMDVATKKYVDDNAGGSGSSFDLSDRIAKGVDDNENTVKGAVIEGCIKDEEITDEQGTYTINKNKASGEYSHAEGFRTTASSNASHAEGGGTTASGMGSHAEGSTTTASSYASHAECENTIASGEASHAEGVFAKASGMGSHAEGGNTTASGKYSHAGGMNTTASGMSSHAEGIGTIANGTALHVFGKYNIEPYAEDDPYVEVVGNGTGDDNRSNARTLDWQGNERLAGSLTLGDGTNDVVTISAAQLKNLLTPLIITETYDESTHVATLNMTWQQIYDAFVSGRKVLTFFEDSASSYGPISYISFGDNIYIVDIDGVRYGCDTASGYPSTGSEEPTA